MVSPFNVGNPSADVSLIAHRILPLAYFSAMYLQRCSFSLFLFFGVSLIASGSPDMVVNLLSES